MAIDVGPELQQHPFLAGLPPASVSVLAACARTARFETGQYLTRAGSDADRFYLLQSGHVRVSAPSPTGPLSVHTAASGELVGWSFIVAPYRYRFDTCATEPTEALEIDGPCVRATYDQRPALGYPVLLRVTAALGTRVQDLQFRLLNCYQAPCQ